MPKVTLIVKQKFARFCSKCDQWFARKYLRALLCPCCHNFLRETVRDMTKTSARYLGQRKWYLRNRDRILRKQKAYNKVKYQEIRNYKKVYLGKQER